MGMDIFNSFSHDTLNVAVIGASGGIGAAFVDHLAGMGCVDCVHAFSRSKAVFEHENVITGFLDFADEASIEAAAAQAAENAKLDLVIAASGMLHDGLTQPEKALRDIEPTNFEKLFLVNTIGPALVAKHFLKHIHKDQRSIFAALSARVGSIEDNVLGGWYAYRASKAALNMVLKTTAIEVSRRYKHAVIAALHPGTVATGLSQPFQGNVPEGKLFMPNYSASCLLKVLDDLTPKDSGKLVAWDGEIIPY